MGQVLQSGTTSIITKHLINITKNDNIKFNGLTRVQKYMTTDQKKNLYSLYLLNRSSLIALYYGIGRINSIYERCLCLIQQNYACDFEVLLENANEKPIHQKCIEVPMIEVYKYLNGLSPDIMGDIFKLRENAYNLRNFLIFESQNSRTKNWA